ncbi:hypothetical protein AA313_de0206027 [Arthrobotrys entomopaga]|nr:hypothetical protein AA313_de0206027 [Arthrobotrys entomopaga]
MTREIDLPVPPPPPPPVSPSQPASKQPINNVNEPGPDGLVNVYHKTNEGPICRREPPPQPQLQLQPQNDKKIKIKEKEKEKEKESSRNYGSRSEVCGDYCGCCSSITGCFKSCFGKAGRMSRNCDCQGDCDMCFCCYC